MRLAAYFVRTPVPEGLVLWRQNEASDGLYVVESGILRAVYRFSEHTPIVEESMVPGTLAGELSALSSLPRNATVVVERAAVLWKLSIVDLRRLEGDDPGLASAFTQVLLKGAWSFFFERWRERWRLRAFSFFFWDSGEN